MNKRRVTIPFETLRSLLPQTLDRLPNPIEFRAVVDGALTSERKDWVGIGFVGREPADGTEPVLVLDEETVHFELREAQKRAPALAPGNQNRLWLRCAQCGHYQYRDYTPYSFANPILVPACGHRYADLHECVTLQQRAGSKRLRPEWHAIMDVLDRQARDYIDSLKPKRRKTAT